MASAGVAGPSPAAIAASTAVWKRRERHHDVSAQTGATPGGRYVGTEPRAKTSMTIMLPPQHGHGRGRIREPSGAVFSGGCVSLPATAKTASNARALAMFPLQLPLARSP